MSTLKKEIIKKYKPESTFDDLSDKVQNLIQELCKDTLESNVDLFSVQSEKIEYKSRDGFIPSPYNKGGIVVQGFTDLMSIYGSGSYPAHKEARKEIERQIDLDMENVIESLIDYMGQDFEYYFNSDKSKVNYGDMQNLYNTLKAQKQDKSADKIYEYMDKYQELELQYMGDENSSIMYEVQFMYHGKNNGVNKASVSCAVNTEGPYHRRSISWAPGVFCEGAKEVEIRWTSQKELKEKLAKALEVTSKAVF